MLKAERVGDRIYSFFNERRIDPSKISYTFKLKLTPEQEKKLQEDPKNDIYSIHFFHPKQVISYFCDECENTFQEEPKIEAYIRPEKISRERPHAVASLLYKCKNCDKTFYIGTIIDNLKEIPLEFIKFDGTGDYKKPTPESIEELLAEVEEAARAGYKNDEQIATCRHWAEKINYILDEERIKNIGVIQRETYLKNFEKTLPELIETIKQNSYAFDISNNTDAECSMYEGTGLAGDMEHLLENLQHINLPEDEKIKEDILKILFLYRRMHDNNMTRIINEKQEAEKRFNEHIRAMQNISRKTTHLISQYCEKAGIDKEKTDQISDAAKEYDFLDATLNYAEHGHSDSEQKDDIPF